MNVTPATSDSEVPAMVARWPGAEEPAGGATSAPGTAGNSLGEDLFDTWVRAGRPWLRTLYRLSWSGIWLVFVGYAISDILAKHWGPLRTAVAWASLVVFAALYMVTMWLATSFQQARQRPLRLLPYTLFVVLTITLTLVFGGNFGGLLIYAGVATGWTFRARVAALILGLLGAFIFAGLAFGYQLSDVLFDAFMTVALGATMMFFRGVIWLTIELRAARQEVARLAVAEERLRFSRDLHDVLGHSLSVIALKSQVARRLMGQDPEAAAAALGDLESVAHDSLAAVREMVTGYRQRSLADELHSAEEVLRAAGITAQVGETGVALSESNDSLLAWSVREGITNVLRHSGARHCRISIRPDPGSVILEILDDGHGAAATPLPGRGGSGLRGLRERLATADGTLEAGSRPEGGFRLAVRVPAR